jgi:hypothetical protein
VTQTLRGRHFVLLDLEGFSRQFEALDVSGLPVTVLQARASHIPAAMDGVKALLVRPDGYVAWASTEVGRAGEAEAQIGKWLKR